MWDIGKELNKVVLGFLRQILGVHKKTTSVAILSETGKFPIALKILKQITRYWRRIETSEKTLLAAARKANKEMQKKNNQNWTKIVNYLLKITGCNTETKQSTFEQELEKLYKTWWKEQAKPTGTNKLDFYYRYKTSFCFEKYLDDVPHHIRKHITRLRLSSHSFPVEVQRYNKKKIIREDRKCTICNMNKPGDEEHYLLECSDAEISYIRDKFMREIRESIPQLKEFSNKNIIDYGLILHDQRMETKMATFVKDIMTTYSAEMDGHSETTQSPVKTRVGRLIRKPEKMNL